MVTVLVLCVCFGQKTSVSTIEVEEKGNSLVRIGVKIERLYRKAEGELVLK